MNRWKDKREVSDASQTTRTYCGEGGKKAKKAVRTGELKVARGRSANESTKDARRNGSGAWKMGVSG
jgi:hypothetical protein